MGGGGDGGMKRQVSKTGRSLLLILTLQKINRRHLLYYVLIASPSVQEACKLQSCWSGMPAKLTSSLRYLFGPFPSNTSSLLNLFSICIFFSRNWMYVPATSAVCPLDQLAQEADRWILYNILMYITRPLSSFHLLLLRFICSFINLSSLSYVCLSSVCMFVSCLTVCLSVCLYWCLSVCLFFCLTICLWVCLYICLFICLYVWLSFYLCVWLDVCLSVCMSVCFSIFLSVFTAVYVCSSVFLYVFLSVCFFYLLSLSSVWRYRQLVPHHLDLHQLLLHWRACDAPGCEHPRAQVQVQPRHVLGARSLWYPCSSQI